MWVKLNLRGGVKEEKKRFFEFFFVSFKNVRIFATDLNGQ